MNSLSWLLYGANVASNAGVFLTMGATILGIGGVCAFVVGAMIRDFASDFRDQKKEDSAAEGKKLQSYSPKLFLAAAIFAGLSVVVPSKDTLMMIAASEVGETVIASAAAQELGGEAGALATDSLKLLRKYVTEQLGEAAP